MSQGIIEGDQIEVAAFSLESFAYLTGLVTANNNAGSNCARARRLIQIEPSKLSGPNQGILYFENEPLNRTQSTNIEIITNEMKIRSSIKY